MIDEQPTTPPVEGSPEGTGSQATDSIVQEETQEINQPQDTGKSTVEDSVQQSSNQTSERPKVSDFFHKREREKRRFSAMETQIRQLREELQKIGSQKPSSERPSDESEYEAFSKQFWDPKNDPSKVTFEYLKKLEKQLSDKYEERIKTFKEKDLGEAINNIESGKKIQSEKLEALEMLFPKDERNPNLSIEQRIELQQDKLAKLNEIEQANGLAGMLDENPKAYANLMLKLYKYDLASQKPMAPKKGNMGSIVTGTPVGKSGGKSSMTLNEIMAEKAKLDKAIDENPNIRYEPKFKEQRAKIIELLDQRAKELGGQVA